MPIVVSCRCGQSYQAPDTLAGKQVKCPSCGQVLTVGAGGAAASASDPLGLGGAGGFGAAPTYGSPSQYAPTTAYQQPTYQTPGYSQPAYSQPTYAQPGLAPGAYGRPGAPARSSGGSKKGLLIGLAIGGGVLGLGLVGVVVLALLLPAVQKAREAGREAAARQQAAAGQGGGGGVAPTPVSGGASGGNIAGGGVGKPDIPASWKKYDSPSEQFSIYFPGNPKHTSKSIPAAGTFLKAQVHQYETPQGVFQIATTELGEAPQFQGDQLRQILDLGIDEVLKNLRGTSRTKSDVTHQGFQGREFTFDARVGATQAEGHGRAFLGVGRTYELLWLGAKGKKPSSDVTRFFTSLDITAKPPQPGAGNTAGPGGGIPGLPPGFGSPPGSGIPGGGIPGGNIPGGAVPGGVPQLPNGINGGPNAGGSPPYAGGSPVPGGSPFPGGSPVPGGIPNAGGSPVPTLPGGVPGGVPGGIPGGPGFPGNGSPPTPGGGPGGPGGFGPGGFRPGGPPTQPGGPGGFPRPR